MIIKNTQLTPEMVTDLQKLQARCKAADGDQISIYEPILSKDRPWTTNYLYYEDNTLVGFLSSFVFYENACEVALMVAPHRRRQGISRQLLTEFLVQLHYSSLKKVIFSCIPALGKSSLAPLGFTYKNSEITMGVFELHSYDLSTEDLPIREATEEDVIALTHIDLAAFSSNEVNVNRIGDLLKQDDYTVLVASYNQFPIGKAHLYWKDDLVHLSDVAVIPAMQRKGYGTILLKYCINLAIERQYKNVTLEVETSNQDALKLYSNLGFNKTNECEFWQLDLSDFIRLFQE